MGHTLHIKEKAGNGPEKNRADENRISGFPEKTFEGPDRMDPGAYPRRRYTGSIPVRPFPLMRGKSFSRIKKTSTGSVAGGCGPFLRNEPFPIHREIYHSTL